MPDLPAWFASAWIASTLLAGLAGGVLIGLAAALLLLGLGRIAGISGILGGLLSRSGDRAWRAAFLAGLMGAGALTMHLLGQATPSPASPPMLLLAGVLVGYGTSLGNGCTSGHGVCGLGRLSKRSFVAVLVFMGTAFLTVFVTRHALGGAP
ncbi:YeeE/YedE family protein [Agrilutibacter solisilvae]|uniref:YeeE/YedE family protein n=1 Tax=Agrilutibacter solisilvae TaxID=2763317 RepID=A0A974XWD3_9GAMM|nr:YeeE/YedE family protein [Lysobacter solisilvae]QSX77072.1 YeeE/YedE family protein [Lysobacter solisilvae]